MMKNNLFIFVLLVGAVWLAGCGGRNSANSSGNLNISVNAGSTMVGTTDLMITVKDTEGNAVNDATVGIKGDMSHAGMQPVLGESSTSNGEGMYMIPYEWTMAGDWFVTVNVSLADGTTESQRFDFNGISGEMDMDMEDSDMDHGEMEMEEATE